MDSYKSLTYKNSVLFAKLSQEQFIREEKRYADNEACFVFVKSGACYVRAQDEYILLEEKSGLFAKCLNYYFESTTSTENTQSIELIAILIQADILEEIYDFNMDNHTKSYNFNIKKIELNSLLYNFISSIDILLDNPELSDDILIKTKLKEFILLLVKSQNIDSTLDFLSGMFHIKNVEFKRIIQHNQFSTLSIEQYAFLCHMSLSSFNRTFKEIFSTTPKKYIMNQKLQRAEQLLIHADLSITQIAFEVGFDSLATFNRNFKKMYEVSPSQIRLNKSDNFLK